MQVERDHRYLNWSLEKPQVAKIRAAEERRAELSREILVLYRQMKCMRIPMSDSKHNSNVCEQM